MSELPQRPPRLRRVFQKYDPPLYFVTICVKERTAILAEPLLHERFILFGAKLSKAGSSLGRYIIMPDHIHCFIRIGPSHKIGSTVGFLKRSLSVALNELGHVQPHWQEGFFDHLIRSSDSYSEKWDYVYHNPVRAGFVERPEDWAFQGEIEHISY